MNKEPNATPTSAIVGNLVVPAKAKFAVVAARMNSFIVDRLVEGAFDALLRHGADVDRITLVRVPGSWEMPLACARLAQSKQFDAIVAVSAVIHGGTPHFEYVAAEVTKGLASVAVATGVPVCLGVLTTDTLEQAVDRAGVKAGNKGFDAAMAAIEMVSLIRELGNRGF
jgi:6,7-dimethyl-8-ribityllumazine synthase